ncbi:MAG: hypothetical protein AAF740_14835, partial [Bacteroidota bacterium]
VKAEFSDYKLYPTLGELVEHHRNLIQLQKHKDQLSKSFPKEMERIDWKKLRLSYKKLLEDDLTMNELDEIIEYAIPQMDRALQDGKSKYEEVAEQIRLMPVGITPLYFLEGYVFLEEAYRKQILVYRYAVTIFQQAQETFRAIQWKFIESVGRKLSQTHEALKLSLVRRYQQLPNPATFLILLEEPFPFEATYLPIAKRTLMQHLAMLEQQNNV